MRLFKRDKKIYLSYAKAGVGAILFLLVAVPFVKKVEKTDNEITYTPESRYLVTLNGEDVGYVSDPSVADQALLVARDQINEESGSVALVGASVRYTEDTNGGSVSSEKEITDALYTSLVSEVVSTDDTAEAYTVRIDDFTVTLASLDDVTELLELVKARYIDSDKFTIELVEDDNEIYTSYKTNFISSDYEINQAAQVLASSDGEDVAIEETAEDEIVYTEGVLAVEFAESVEVIKVSITEDSDEVLSVEDAYELVTKEHAEKTQYTVKSGDCLISIATSFGLTLEELLALNSGITVESLILPGDSLIVQVPASEISVKVVEETAYDEEYNAETQYIDSAAYYVGTQHVVQNAIPGTRSVVALVTYINGVESSREIIEEEIITEAVPAIVERGTLTPPTYLKPIYGGTITSPFGYRIHPIYGTYTLHSGVDWYVPSGTAVMASASGTVIQAGWNGGYGISVTIQHSDGSQTRYAHLSSAAVGAWQTVYQGQIIGYSGCTGNATGPHLHFEIIIGGNYVNPLSYVQ